MPTHRCHRGSESDRYDQSRRHRLSTVALSAVKLQLHSIPRFLCRRRLKLVHGEASPASFTPRTTPAQSGEPQLISC
jgi:hypothetical protein